MSSIFLLFTMVWTVLFFSLWRKPVIDALLDLRMTACLMRLVQKEMHFPTILLGPLRFITERCPSCLSSKDNNFSLFYTTTEMTGDNSSATGLFKVKKKNSKLLCDIEGLLDHQPIFLHSHLLTHFPLSSPSLHTLHLLSCKVAVA